MSRYIIVFVAHCCCMMQVVTGNFREFDRVDTVVGWEAAVDGYIAGQSNMPPRKSIRELSEANI